MNFKEPENTDLIYWTRHSKEKMRFYNLSEQRLKRILRNPQREEKGIAPATVAIMQKAGTKKKPSEIWLMYQKAKTKELKNQKAKKQPRIRIISAWRYPGISPIGSPPIPEEVLRLLEQDNLV